MVVCAPASIVLALATAVLIATIVMNGICSVYNDINAYKKVKQGDPVCALNKKQNIITEFK